MATLARWKSLWETWDLRDVILFSLVLQIFLTFFAPLRKRVSTAWLTTPIWLAYLLADVSANFAVGLISNSQSDTSGPFANPTILAFWATFLLVHLGGPDTITAFALEDNELWLRHLLGLGFQCWAVGYAFFHSFPDHKFWLPTLLMFVAGVIKYAERTRALYLASSRRFKASFLTEPDPGPNYAKLVNEFTPNMGATLKKKIEWIPVRSRISTMGNEEGLNKLSDLTVVQVAHTYFATFKGLIADSIFSLHERDQSREFFLKRTARDAFKVVEVELNFFYEILYTKAAVVQGKLGYPLRIFSFSLSWAAIVLFYFIKKEEFKKFDIGISYTLLLVAIALDLIGCLMVLYSDWTAVALTKSDLPNWFITILGTLLNVNRESWPRCPFFGRIMQIVHLRWSESLFQYDLINYCLHPRSKWLEATIGTFGLTDMLDGVKYVKSVDFTNHLRNLIFTELKMKSELADDLETAKEIFSARGDWILQFENCPDHLLRWISDVEFDESIILWHIATDLCYYTEEVPDANDGEDPTNLGQTNSDTEDIKDYHVLSKLLSDYLLYLLIMQSTMLSTAAGIGQTRFRDTCAEAKRFFLETKIRKSEEGKMWCLNIFNFLKCFCGNETENGQSQSQTSNCFNKCCSKGEKELQIEACKNILGVTTEVEPFAIKGERSKSVLFDACMLAKELKKLERQRMWQIISKVWVELLSYAACRCNANSHMAQLSKGGQLLTLVWMLMVHLGFGDQFQIIEGHARAKLMVRK
ncbi:hypothetical protein RHSIM_RhsimUnG0200800 [Rhododendron simsii]|uniref:DUF4220 domain-containing protein n=1 Tax=Rhododendron simsii TaxID=118357 RepID=A0A834FUC7_RHOSS|nr:hypothetical protein RHSIM_RhsimUnG0200800 [Rhododendron simsii]